MRRYKKAWIYFIRSAFFYHLVDKYPFFLKAMLVTLQLTVASMAIGLIIGLFFCLTKVISFFHPAYDRRLIYYDCSCNSAYCTDLCFIFWIYGDYLIHSVLGCLACSSFSQWCLYCRNIPGRHPVD